MYLIETPVCRIRVRLATPSSVATAAIAAFMWLTASPLSAQTETASAPPRLIPPQAPRTVRPTVGAVRFTEAPIIDGRVDDSMWRTAAHLTEFVQQDPVEGAPASERMDVYIGYDSQKLYFAIYAHYSDIGLMRANRVERDKTDNDDIVTISFDPFLDSQLGYSFSVNGYGVQGDSTLRGNTGGGGGVVTSTDATGDITWDALFTTAGQLVEDGWTAEMAIPLKSLRYPARAGNEAHRWGFQIERQIRSTNETDVWAPMSRDVAGFLRQMGVLDGISNLSTSRNFEILPTFTAGHQETLNRTSGTSVSYTSKDVGVNLKYGFTPNLTLDFTLNPDFSQIESDRDQIEVNQRFPIQYPELRPFFLEGIDTFRVQGPATFIHTRTIVDPQYAAKLTGKVGKATVGLLIANDEAPGRLVESPDDPTYGKVANIVIGRARWDFAPQQWVGGIYSDREFLGSYSRFGGVDAPLQFGNNLLFRPVAYFSDRRDLAGVRTTGYVFNPFLVKSGRNFGMTLYHFQISPDFATDLGFIRQTDQKSTGLTLSYKWWPESWIVNWGPEYMTRRIYDFESVLQNADQSAKFSIQFARNMSVTTTVTHNMERYREVDFVKDRILVSATVNANRRILFTGTMSRGDEIRFTVNPYLGHNTIYGVAATIRPISRWQSILNLDTTRFVDVRTNTEVFDIKILRVLTTYQFTPRLAVRNIMQRNTFNRTLDANLLLTYRVNSGTAFYLGYDDHYIQEEAIGQGDSTSAKLSPGTALERTNRAVFMKIQYLFRGN